MPCITSRACLDQLLITIVLLLIAFDHVRSKTKQTPFLPSPSILSALHSLGTGRASSICNLIPNCRDTKLPTSTSRPTVHPHCHIDCAQWPIKVATLGGAFDHDHWLWSAVADVTIIDHFVRWSRQAKVKFIVQYLINNYNKVVVLDSKCSLASVLGKSTHFGLALVFF